MTKEREQQIRGMAGRREMVGWLAAEELLDEIDRLRLVNDQLRRDAAHVLAYLDTVRGKRDAQPA